MKFSFLLNLTGVVVSSTMLAVSSADAAKLKTVAGVANAASAAPVQVPAPAQASLAGFNFLILALDDIDLSQINRAPEPPTNGPTLPLVPADSPTARVAPPGVPTVSNEPRRSITPKVAPHAPEFPETPDVPDTDHPPPSIRPLNRLSLNNTPQSAAFWQVAARQGFQFIATKKEPTETIIKPGPLPRSPDIEKPLLVPFGGVSPDGDTPPVPDKSKDDNSKAAAGDGFSSLAPTTRVSRAQGAAVPLRRALLNSGCVDVLITGADGSRVVDLFANHRLSARTFDDLQDGMGRLMVGGKTSADDENLRGLIRSAARVGQALGYRGVIVLALLPQPAQPKAPKNSVAKPTVEATYGLVIADATRESGEPLVFDEKGVDDVAMHEAAALTERAVIEKVATNWTPVLADEKRQLSLNYLNQARDLLVQTAVMQSNAPEAKRLQNEAIDTLNQSLAMDENQAEAYIMLGDLLAINDAAGAANEYNRAATLRPKDGKVWAKVAIAYTKGATPDWPNALSAANRALALGYESAELHLAYAVTQWGRATIFRRYNAEDRAVAAEVDARQHLDLALRQAPQDDPGVMRDIAAQLVTQGRYKEGVSVLERLTKIYPGDKSMQLLLAQSLLNVPNQQEAAFVAWAKVWKTQNLAQVSLDAVQYNTIMEGFDRNVASIGKDAARLAGGVAQAGVPREQALLQMIRLRDDMNIAQDTVKILVAPTALQRQDHNSRIFAVDLMTQAFGNYIMYLETADATMLNRATDLHRQAIVTLNLVRTTK